MFVTDLDGTLLSHHDYTFDAALPAVAALRDAGLPLVLATSKTGAEVAPLHAALLLRDVPAIVENGAGIYWPNAADTVQETSAYQSLRAAVEELPDALRAGFTGFGDWGPQEVSARTGLSRDAAERACTRAHSEAGIWNGSAAALVEFRAALGTHGIEARQGGRFLTLSFGRTKADAMAEIAHYLNATGVVAIGDAPNDVEMLESADIGVVIRNDHGAPLPPLRGEAQGRIRRSAQEAPHGWNTEVLRILAEIDASG